MRQQPELSREDQALMPGREDLNFYQQHGWYLSKKLFTDEEIAALAQASENFYQHGPDQKLPHHPDQLAYWQASDGEVQRHNDYIAYENNTIRGILSKPIIGAVAAMLAQTDAIRIFQSTLISKPADANEKSNIVPWHFDKHYWSTCSSHEMLTAFIPFQDCNENNGTIAMIDGSHLWDELPANSSVHKHFAQRDPAELEIMLRENALHNAAKVKKVLIDIPAGHVSFHHCRTYHGSGANLSAQPRRAISLHLQPADNHWVAPSNTHGAIQSYNHDTLVGATTHGTPDYHDAKFCPVIWSQ